MKESTNPLVLPENKWYRPQGDFQFESESYDVNQYLDYTRTEGLLIIHRDTIIFEDYRLGLERDEAHISWSMAKSFTSALIGIFHDKGLFNLDDPVGKHLPDFIGTAYENVTIYNLLTMSSGVRFNEDYGDYNSDINRFGRAFAVGSPIRDFAKSLEREREQGTYNHYVSIDTQILAFLLMKLSGKSITELTQEYIWEPIGMEHEASWIIDRDGEEIALGGLNASLRDFSKLGLAYKNKGFINGAQIIPADWIEACLNNDQEHLKAGNNKLSSNIHGYGLQWWIPVNNPDAFAMGGIYNQYVYVDPVNDIIIAKLSANHNYKTQGHITKAIHFVMFDAIIEDILIKEKEIRN